MKRHFEHVQQRQKRVVKYGQAETGPGASKAPSSGGSKNYAMFSDNKLAGPPTALGGAGGNSALRRRVAAGGTTTSAKNNSSNSNINSGSGSGTSGVYGQHDSRGDTGGDDSNYSATPYRMSAQEIRKNANERAQGAESIEAIVSKVSISD
jgi:hypothetical protein